MPHIYLCVLWHMHQPFYKDLISGEYRLPWTRLHALRDYYGMVQILREFPRVHQTFNVVPSLMLQVEEYAEDKALDPFLQCALKPSDGLSEDDANCLLSYCFQTNPERLVPRFPRYGELYDAFRAAGGSAVLKGSRALRFFGTQTLRDLQVLSQLVWFDEEFLANDPEVKALVHKGRDYGPEDQALVGRKQLEILNAVLPVYRESSARGQIEISTTPFYHPILPLLCDSNIAEVSHPGVSLPARFRHPEDARLQLDRSRQYFESRFNHPPAGLWPSEGSVSDEVLGIAADLGFRWTASDNGVLSRTLHGSAGPDETYRPYLWQQGDRQIHVLFRDHFLSDLVGFVYADMGAAEAAGDFLDRIRQNCRRTLQEGRDALVPIFLDGENAWDRYESNGRPFLRELYRRILEDSQFEALTISEALDRLEPQKLDHIFPGSWINSNFDIWIGAEEDNKAWEHLSRARQTYERVTTASGAPSISADDAKLALEELLIAEGSDWCWWYGPEHESVNRPEFDQLFRDHLANIYRALKLTPPEELSHPILSVVSEAHHVPPVAPIRPKVDGEVTSYFEWLGAGVYRADVRSGSMHGGERTIHELYYGCDEHNLYLRLDFAVPPAGLSGLEVRLVMQPKTDDSRASSLSIMLQERGAVFANLQIGSTSEAGHEGPEVAFQTVLEIRLPLAALGMRRGQMLRCQFSLWRTGLPVDRLPRDNWLELPTRKPAEWPV